MLGSDLDYLDEKMLNHKVCCSNMDTAFKWGTDREGFGSLATLNGGRVYFGSDIPCIKYCPWCGKEIDLKSLLKEK